MTRSIDGLRFVRELWALAKPLGDGAGRCALAAPMPGYYRGEPGPGTLLVEGQLLGELEVLGVRCRLRVPAGVRGAVVPAIGTRRMARRPVGYGETLVIVDPSAVAVGASGVTSSVREAHATGALVFRAPMSGRFYAKPAPDAEPFVRPGEIVEVGRTVALLEVMKTFTRVQYGGAGLPERARVVAVLANDGDDVEQGSALFELEPA